MEEKLYSGTICKLNSVEVDYRTELQFDELNRGVITFHKVLPEIVEILQDRNDENVVIIRLDNGGYLSIFRAYVRQGTFSAEIIDNLPCDSTAEITIVSSSIIKGQKIFSEEDKFEKLWFEITDGHELIGESPYDLNSGYKDIQQYEKVEIPMKYKCISVSTILGDLDFVVIPKYWFKRDSFSIGFSHCITFKPTKAISFKDFHKTLPQITDFFSLLCGEQVTINRLSIVEVTKEGIDEYDYIGYCSFPRISLNALNNSGIDTNNFKSISLFKLTDFPELKPALDYWFEHYEALYNAQQAYGRILLDEDTKLVTVNRYLAAMQLVEGFSQAYADEKKETADFKKRKKDIMAQLQDEDDKRFVKSGLMMPGVTFKKAVVNYYLKGLSAFKEMTEEEFNKNYDESLITKIVNDRNFYTHSSKRITPLLNFDELIDIATVTKELYRCLLLSNMGISKKLISKRFYHNRIMEGKINQIFQIRIIADDDVSGFDALMWHFTDQRK